ncbi:hypothetical protein A3D00_02265 [Candidatus Woesebacteria bacterium RIFCSPHIGHO2_02_FULL_38_9]|uniref:Glycosyltransferase RgtA/B/C/D-like domain-containing protein n=1 Tax=Candidatus Woesebacteria bacterium RIFCSPHIGHO2_01_FULL_39_28 TaxID=1802496 RepID=A0A1F7YHC4_9BACT|nr:MAG: hypothetical protein A2627_02205 [Candidatus Woesebacteria bacterium RIFCSPHIGHO2_01_FULL_39_28]OGM32789.1 MAG: hypothetical protein A3D00_02265 [Candidatus Woesebacteria bacterium RIFCSPHIGHO2_02_FULL_38_9]OGM58148.1 MAG: hypothetical protein A3A50_00085 [Candidatus Woesebacteria bacterium RIFCSPLOWO2_01_FULL_38_20]
MKRKFFLILLLALVVRVVFVKQGLTGDITAFAEWGEKILKMDLKNFYTNRDWYYTYPVYPPISNLFFGGISWLNEHKFVLAQIHNITKLIPAPFIIFFGKIVPESPLMYNYGYFLLLKLIPILSDLAVSLLIYKIVKQISKSSKKALFGSILYLFNPVSIFLSGVWGQTESLVALPAVLAFYFLYRKKSYFSIPLFFMSLYIKPTWAYTIPFYLFSLYIFKPRIKHVIVGLVLALVIFLMTTMPFIKDTLFIFIKGVLLGQMVPSFRGDIPKLSNSAFNFYTIFWQIDRVFLTKQMSIVSLTFYSIINILAFKTVLNDKKRNLLTLIFSLFIVLFGSYLFMPNMLERYSFPAFIPTIILVVSDFKKFRELLIVNLIIFANLFWSFYRRGSDELDHIFTNNNFLTIRILSLILILLYLIVLQFRNDRRFGRTFGSDGRDYS